MLDEAQKKLDTADKEVNKILRQAKDDSEKLVIEMNEKFHNSSEIKNGAQKRRKRSPIGVPASVWQSRLFCSLVSTNLVQSEGSWRADTD